MNLKSKDLGSAWITNAFKKSLKKKQLHEGFLKTESTISIETYRSYENFFEKQKEAPKI